VSEWPHTGYVVVVVVVVVLEVVLHIPFLRP